MAIGAAVQGSIGFGAGLLAGPVLLLIDPRFVPGPLLAAGLVLTILVAHREWEAIDYPALWQLTLGRFLGTLPAAGLLAVVSRAAFDTVFGVLVLIAVALTLAGGTPRRTPARVVAAGVASGFMGTISSIGGPAAAFALQGVSGPRFRATLAMQLLVGGSISLLAVFFAGYFGAGEVALAGILVPGVLLGFGVSRFGVRRLSATGLRPAVLALACAGALIVLARGVRAWLLT
jgi:hypothetical protein